MNSIEHERICELARSDGRYHREAFLFTLDALHFTLKRFEKGGHVGHIDGRQLCDGIRDYACESFGYLSKTVFSLWGVRRTEDFGEIVFLLANANIIKKQESDSPSDFEGVYDFEEVFERELIHD